VAGYKITNRTNDAPGEWNTWNGYPRGELKLSWHFDIEQCPPLVGLIGGIACGTQSQLYHATYDHYDRTASARMGYRDESLARLLASLPEPDISQFSRDSNEAAARVLDSLSELDP
jgi:hypothetical protein